MKPGKNALCLRIAMHRRRVSGELSSYVHACMRSVPIDPIRRRSDVAAGERSPSPVPTVSRPTRVESPPFGSCLNSDRFGGQRLRLREGQL